MSCADLHVHSEYSKHPSEWFLQRLGAQESYTQLSEVYSIAKNLGMRFVTLTDHNTIEGAKRLAALYPEEAFISVEATTYFPENGCKVHVLIYDITEEQFAEIDVLRANIYDLREYIKKNDLAYSVAHATYSINGKLTYEILERLIVLFDVFESINGARNPHYNSLWTEALTALTQQDIERLQARYGIEPISNTPWKKGFTGGSDDHAGLFIGKTVTLSEAETKHDFIRSIKEKRTVAAGRGNDFKSFAFTIYKIAYDFSRHKTSSKGHDFLTILNRLLFEKQKGSFKSWLAMHRMKRKKNDTDKIIARFFSDLVVEIGSEPTIGTEEKIDRIYKSISQLLDDFFTMVMTSCFQNFKAGETGKMVKNLCAALPTVFLAAPFFSSLKHLHSDRELIHRLEDNYIEKKSPRKKRILWFTDTVNDVNGVAVSLKKFVAVAKKEKRHVRLAVAETQVEADDFIADRIVNFPVVYSYKPDFYDNYAMTFPSLLRSLEMIYAENPDEIIISTPGPVGIVGLIAGRILGIPVSGIYHTDFTTQAELILHDSTLTALAENYNRFFYSLMDEIKVPTEQYIELLAERGYEAEKMSVFKRGIDLTLFRPTTHRRDEIIRTYAIQDGFTLLWAGRVSRDKNIDFLAEVYKEIIKHKSDVNLILAGIGPALEELKTMFKEYPRVIFTGRIDRQELPYFYSLADAFIFPSTVDTFGMVILEAQACGLPAVVTDVGGPQEIVDDKKTGFVLPAFDLEAWVHTVMHLMKIKECEPALYERVRLCARSMVEKKYTWEKALEAIVGKKRSATVVKPRFNMSVKKHAINANKLAQ
jgi:glycosyltransferase involved in cell wall biosynthesis/predicted metal-dependent phosphoesterase TrpH